MPSHSESEPESEAEYNDDGEQDANVESMRECADADGLVLS